MAAFRRFFKVFLGCLFFLTACNLAQAPVTTGPAATVDASALSVQITAPTANSQIPAGTPLQVTFKASGGPFIEFDLSVDGNLVMTAPATSSDPQVAGSLQWETPAEGSHTLTVVVLDVNKNSAVAALPVEVTGSTGPASTTATTAPASSDGLQIRFTNLTDGGSVSASTGTDGKPLVSVQFEVTGLAPLAVTLTANGLHIPGEAANPGATLPFSGAIPWSPSNGAGQYTLVAQAMSEDKQFATASATVTVTGLAAFTATPPPPDLVEAQTRFSQLYRQLYQIDIPRPSVERFDSPQRPDLSRWISSIYYKGQRYYIDLYDDTHYEAATPLPYAGPVGHPQDDNYRLCRPTGEYRILVVFVDYGNLAVDKNAVLAQVPVIAEWTNELYQRFSASQTAKGSPPHLTAKSAWIDSPPSPGNTLTRAQITASTGVELSQYDLIFEIDLDKNNTMAAKDFPGVLDHGGGLALQGCGGFGKMGEVNIWSVVLSPVNTQQEVEGNLSMDFNHELSHLFGMIDNYPFKSASITSPDGARHDDWITYNLFGWTDADGDGIVEIIDPTPYGTSGPQP